MGHSQILRSSITVRGNTDTSRFYTGQQAANLAVLFADRSADLARRRCIGGLFWSTNLTPQRVPLFPPPPLCKSEPSMFPTIV